MARMTKLKICIQLGNAGRNMCFVSCAPSFVLKDHKYILSCVIIRCKQPVERKQRRAENETVVFISSSFFSIFIFIFYFFLKIMQSEQR